MPEKPDAEMAEFEAALLRSAKQAVQGDFARVHTPAEIDRRRGYRRSPALNNSPPATHHPHTLLG